MCLFVDIIAFWRGEVNFAALHLFYLKLKEAWMDVGERKLELGRCWAGLC
jgi:hypothetical protein